MYHANLMLRTCGDAAGHVGHDDGGGQDDGRHQQCHGRQKAHVGRGEEEAL